MTIMRTLSLLTLGLMTTGCAAVDGGLGTVPSSAAERVAGLKFVCVGSWPDDHFLKHTFAELPGYSNNPAAISRLCSMVGTRGSVFEGEGFMRLYVSGRDVRRLAALNFRPEEHGRVTFCRGRNRSRGDSSQERTLYFFPLQASIQQIPKDLCDAIEPGSFLETAPLVDKWKINLYGTEADKAALCEQGGALIDTSQCQVFEDTDVE